VQLLTALLAVIPPILYRWPRCCWASWWTLQFIAWHFNTNCKDRLQNNALLSGDSEVVHPHEHFAWEDEMED